MDSNVASVSVKIGDLPSLKTDTGKEIEARTADGVVSVTVDLRMDQPDMFAVEYDMMALDKLNLIDAFKPGVEVEIAMGLKEPAALLYGEIAYVEPCFDVENGNHVTISGYHKVHRLTRGQRSKTWGDGLQATIGATTPVKDVINNSKSSEGGKVGDKMTTGEVGSSSVKHHYVPQLNVSDFEFLQAIGASLEMKAGDSSKTQITFRKPEPSGAAVVKIARERSGQGEGSPGAYLHLNFRLSTVQQYAAVEVRSWDFVTKKNIVAKVTSSTYAFDGIKGHSDTGTALYNSGSTGRKYIVVDQPVNTKAEAEAIAQALFDQFSMDFLTGEVTIEGEPKAVPGKVIEFEGFGKAFSGKFLITAATHSYRPDEGYKTTIAFSRNTKGT
ncbi:MAG: phage late control D family protein [Myxococcales bacterium]|nr:phage late control D family protein [Myxococcales bacterium]